MTRMAVHAFTSFSLSYLNRARVLARSLRRQHPDWVIWAVLTDKDPEGFRFDLAAEDFDRMVTAEELFGEVTNRWLFGHDIVEACTAVKGRALQHILADPTAEKVVYFDPDIAVFNSMTPVIDLLDSYAIVLTPHQLEPEPASDHQAIRDNEIASLDFRHLQSRLRRREPERRSAPVRAVVGRSACSSGAMTVVTSGFSSTRSGATSCRAFSMT